MFTAINKLVMYQVYTKDDAYRRLNACTWEAYDLDHGTYHTLDLQEAHELEQELQKFLKEINYES